MRLRRSRRGRRSGARNVLRERLVLFRFGAPGRRGKQIRRRLRTGSDPAKRSNGHRRIFNRRQRIGDRDAPRAGLVRQRLRFCQCAQAATGCFCLGDNRKERCQVGALPGAHPATAAEVELIGRGYPPLDHPPLEGCDVGDMIRNTPLSQQNMLENRRRGRSRRCGTRRIRDRATVPHNMKAVSTRGTTKLDTSATRERRSRKFELIACLTMVALDIHGAALRERRLGRKHGHPPRMVLNVERLDPMNPAAQRGFARVSYVRNRKVRASPCKEWGTAPPTKNTLSGWVYPSWRTKNHSICQLSLEQTRHPEGWSRGSFGSSRWRPLCRHGRRRCCQAP